MSAVEIDDDAISGRLEVYGRTIHAIAIRGAASGKPGAWLELKARIEQALDRSDPSARCDVALHATHLELRLWGEILGTLVRPERQQQLEEAILAVAKDEVRDPDEFHELSLETLCSSGFAAAAVDIPEVSIEELILIRQIREAAGRKTAGALQQALRSWLALSTARTDGSTHGPCDAFDVLTLRAVLIRALAETMPKVCREVLGLWAQRAFYRLHASDEPIPEFLVEVPRHMARGDQVWAFSPAWHGVAFRAGRTNRDGSSDEWLIEELETIARRWELEEAARAQSAEEWLERRVRGEDGPVRLDREGS
jgi:hypothetical protein